MTPGRATRPWRWPWAAAWLSLTASCHCGSPALAPSHPRETAHAAEGPALPPPDGCDPTVPALPAEVQQAVCYAHNYERRGTLGYGTETSARSHGELSALGAEWLSLTPFAFMSSLDAEEVRLPVSYPGAETDEVMRRELSLAAESGFRVVLKPHIWVRGGGYRGDIAMSSAAAWGRWWQSYRRFVLHYAAMAEEYAAEIFVVGVELDQTTGPFEGEWRRLVDEVRRSYSGELVYAANWDRADQVPLWDALDYIGVQFYPPVARPNAPVDGSLLATSLDRLEALSEHSGRRVLLTEVGYRSGVDALMRPHAWPRPEHQPDPEAQARGYRLLFSELARRQFVAGVHVWKWFVNPATHEEGEVGFSPRGKPAEAVLRAAFGGCQPEAPMETR